MDTLDKTEPTDAMDIGFSKVQAFSQFHTEVWLTQIDHTELDDNVLI